MTTKTYYVAGPMRGVIEFNAHGFAAATSMLRAAGHVVFNPMERDIIAGFDPTGLKGSDEELRAFDLRGALADDTQFICIHATHIYMLPGWAGSKGATAERALGLALGLTIEGAPA